MYIGIFEILMFEILTKRFFFNGLLLPYTHSIFFPLFFSVFFLVFFSKIISKLQIKIANQSGTHTMPKPATCQLPMHSYNVFHRRVERPSIAGIGSVPEVALKKEGFCRVLIITVDFLKVKGDIEWQEPYFDFIIIISFV